MQELDVCNGGWRQLEGAASVQIAEGEAGGRLRAHVRCGTQRRRKSVCKETQGGKVHMNISDDWLRLEDDGSGITSHLN